MTVMIDLPADAEKGLRYLAEENCQELSACARSLILDQIRLRVPRDMMEADADADTGALARAIDTMINRTPEQLAEARAQALEMYKPERPLPPGMTIFDVFGDKSPGNETDDDTGALARAINAMINRTHEEIEEARRQVIVVSDPVPPLLPGETIFDAVGGKWPGDETDDQVFKALERLS